MFFICALQKKSRFIRESETGPNPKIDMRLPKMAQPEKPKTFQPKFLSQPYNTGLTSFPKVGDTSNTSVATTTFPPINNFVKPKQKVKITYMNQGKFKKQTCNVLHNRVVYVAFKALHMFKYLSLFTVGVTTCHKEHLW